MMMLSSRRAVLAGLAALVPAAAFAQPRSVGSLGGVVQVPFDHDDPGSGTLALAYEWGAAPDRAKPTVLVVADAQQYFVRAGGAARLQQQLFGSQLNVLTIVGRSRSPDLERRIRTPDGFDWEKAYRALSWRQWSRDIALVITSLGLSSEALGLYGRSGGAHLIHQFLTEHSGMVRRAYVQAAVNHELDAAWGLSPDRFWEELVAADASIAARLTAFLERRPEQRRSLILTLQRQHFFETLEGLPAARISAINAYLSNDQAVIDALTERYQLNAIAQTRTTGEGVGSAVRIFEFAKPHPDPRASARSLRPDVEALFYHGEPYTLAGRSPSTMAPPADFTRLRQQSAEVIQIAGRHDQTCDYRTQIGIHGLTQNSRLLLLDDDHVFRRWGDQGSQAAFLQGFFTGGLGSPGTNEALVRMRPLLWKET